MNLIKTEEDRIEIQLSKFKLTLLLLGAILFVIGGIFFITNPSRFANTDFNHQPKFEILLLGYVCIIFFGACGIIAIIKLFSNKPGLIIDDRGITINPDSFSKLFIRWEEIKSFGIEDVSRAKMIMVYLKYPENFINLLDNKLKRKMALFSFNTYGSPIGITANSLKCSTDELCGILTQKLNEQTH